MELTTMKSESSRFSTANIVAICLVCCAIQFSILVAISPIHVVREFAIVHASRIVLAVIVATLAIKASNLVLLRSMAFAAIVTIIGFAVAIVSNPSGQPMVGHLMLGVVTFVLALFEYWIAEKLVLRVKWSQLKLR